MVKRIIALLLLLIIITATAVNIAAADKREFKLIDSKTDCVYTVIPTGTGTEIYCGENFVGSNKIDDFLTCSVYDGIITFYSPDSANNLLEICRYYSNSNIQKAYAVTASALNDKNCFTSDKNGAVYFVSENYTNQLYKATDSNTETVLLNAYILQLLCLDGETVLAVTDTGIYAYVDGNINKIYDTDISKPLQYQGNNIITDADGNELVYESGYIRDIEAAETSTVTNTDDKPEETSVAEIIAESVETIANGSADVNIEDNICRVTLGTTVSKIKKSLAHLGEIEVAKADGTVIKSGKVGTGATVKLQSGETLTVVILGELTNEGNINSRDVKAVLNHLSEKGTLTGCALMAADANTDGKVTTKDALKIAQMY